MQSEGNSSDVEAITLNSDDENDFMIKSDKPIIQLFQRLISSDNKQSTILTNAQIVVILEKEFDTDISKLTELESDIYLTIMKKFLKDWPQWDELDSVVNKLKNKKDFAGVNRLLESKYISLKQYLRDMLESAQSRVQEQHFNEGKSNDDPKKSFVLEICASRNQLNELFYRQPQPDSNNTIFNATYSVPTQITINMLPLEAILNWWGVSIAITSEPTKNKKMLLYERETLHKIDHILVNKKNKSSTCPVELLPQEIRIKTKVSVRPKTARQIFLQFISHAASEFPNCQEIFEFIKKDIRLLPALFHTSISYYRFMNKYPYVRYLYKDGAFQENSKYDIQLKETVSPQYKTYVGKCYGFDKRLTVKCVPCSINFVGDSLIHDLRSHFMELHMLEPDFKCTNCSKSFTMSHLAQTWWTHRC